MRGNVGYSRIHPINAWERISFCLLRSVIFVINAFRTFRQDAVDFISLSWMARVALLSAVIRCPSILLLSARCIFLYGSCELFTIRLVADMAFYYSSMATFRHCIRRALFPAIVL